MTEEIPPPPFFPGLSPRAARSLFAVAALVALVVTPLDAAFNFRGGFVCAVGLGGGDWIAELPGARHLIAYAILGALAVFSFRGRPLYFGVMIALGVTLLIELEQAVFAAGDCRLRDMLPNFFAVALGTALAILASVWLNRKRD